MLIFGPRSGVGPFLGIHYGLLCRLSLRHVSDALIHPHEAKAYTLLQQELSYSVIKKLYITITWEHRIQKSKNNYSFYIANGVQNVERQRRVTITLEPSIRLRLAGSVNLGHRRHLISQATTTSLMRIFLTGVFLRRRIIVVILIPITSKESGVIQWIFMRVGNIVTFHFALTVCVSDFCCTRFHQFAETLLCLVADKQGGPKSKPLSSIMIKWY